MKAWIANALASPINATLTNGGAPSNNEQYANPLTTQAALISLPRATFDGTPRLSIRCEYHRERDADRICAATCSANNQPAWVA